MKELARFQGRVTKFNQPPELSYVTLKNMENGEMAETDAISEELLKHGIDHGISKKKKIQIYGYTKKR